MKAAPHTSQTSRLFDRIGRALLVCCMAVLSGCGEAGMAPFPEVATAKGRSAESSMTLTPRSFAFSVAQGDGNPTHSLSISNSGKRALKWSASTTASWVTLSPSMGIVNGATSDTVTVLANLSGLASGTYSGTITVEGVSASDRPEDIPVTLTIEAPPTATWTSSMMATTSSASTTPSSSWTAVTASATLSWNQQGDPSVIGYYVHYGTQSPGSVGSCTYGQTVYYSIASLTSASSPTATINSLAVGTTYYFAVSAYNGLESLCSNEVAKDT